MRKTQVIINKSALRRNLEFIQSQCKNHEKIIAIVKANAYGHGAVVIARILSQEGIDGFGVAYTEEGVILRNAGIKEPIIILVQQSEEDIPEIVDYNLQPAVSSIEFLSKLNEEAAKYNKIIKVHLFIDTGMSRDGITAEEAVDFVAETKDMRNIKFEGICTHFSSASLDPVITHHQLDKFNYAIDSLKAAGTEFNLIHAASSAASINFPEARFNAVRPGIVLYGYPPDEQIAYRYNIKPILSLKSNISLLRRIKAGDSVSYSRKFIADRDTTIATVPIGYGDGYIRSLSGKASCIIHNKMYPIVGAICMDELMVNIGDDKLNIGDPVILIGETSSCSVSAYDLANFAGTIPYEITTLIAPRVPRIYVN